MIVLSVPLFSLGQVLATPGALCTLARLGVHPSVLVLRHVCGDWGDVSAEERGLNVQALRDGFRLFSAYRLSSRHTLWVMTTAADSAGRRDATTILLPSEY